MPITLDKALADTPDWDALQHAIEAADDNGLDVTLDDSVDFVRLDATKLCDLHGAIEDAITGRIARIAADRCPNHELADLDVSLVGEVSLALSRGELVASWQVRVRASVMATA